MRVRSRVCICVGMAEVECRVEGILERIDPVGLTVEKRDVKTIWDSDVGKVLFRLLEPLYLERYSEFPKLGRFVVLGIRIRKSANVSS